MNDLFVHSLSKYLERKSVRDDPACWCGSDRLIIHVERSICSNIPFVVVRAEIHQDLYILRIPFSIESFTELYLLLKLVVAAPKFLQLKMFSPVQLFMLAAVFLSLTSSATHHAHCNETQLSDPLPPSQDQFYTPPGELPYHSSRQCTLCTPRRKIVNFCSRQQLRSLQRPLQHERQS